MARNLNGRFGYRACVVACRPVSKHPVAPSPVAPLSALYGVMAEFDNRPPVAAARDYDAGTKIMVLAYRRSFGSIASPRQLPTLVVIGGISLVGIPDAVLPFSLRYRQCGGSHLIWAVLIPLRWRRLLAPIRPVFGMLALNTCRTVAPVFMAQFQMSSGARFSWLSTPDPVRPDDVVNS